MDSDQRHLGAGLPRAHGIGGRRAPVMHFLTPIPEPAAGIYTVRIRCDGQSIFTGDRKSSLACGACGLVLAEGVDPADFADAAFRCICGAWGTTTARG